MPIEMTAIFISHSGWGEEHRPLDGNVLEEVLHVHAEFRQARARERFVETARVGAG
jgi:hypothetical protein